MALTNQTSNLRIDLDSKDFRLSDQEQRKFDADLETLRRSVACFPQAELKVEISKQSYYRVRTSLILPSRTLFTADDDRELHPAWERCEPQEAGLDPSRVADAARHAAEHETPWSRDLARMVTSNFDEAPPWNEPLGSVRPRGGPNGLVLRGGRVVAEWAIPARST